MVSENFEKIACSTLYFAKLLFLGRLIVKNSYTKFDKMNKKIKKKYLLKILILDMSSIEQVDILNNKKKKKRKKKNSSLKGFSSQMKRNPMHQYIS
jgi:hypothetical protein